jgi:anti-sigma28 factor (negative regulator of flagellin synthesis)
MEISFLTKTKALKPGNLRDSARGVKNGEDDKSSVKSKTDSSEISSGRAGAFEDKRLSVAKSALLYELSVDAPESRLNEIREKIDGGEYRVDDEYLAGSLLD